MVAANWRGCDVAPVRVAAKTSDVLEDPSDSAADLIGQHHQAAADILHRSEVRHDIMRPRGEEHLGRPYEILRATAAPGAAMDEDEDQPRGTPDTVDVELLDLGAAIGDALGLANAPAHIGAGGDAAFDQLLAVWRIGGLVIGCVEWCLVVVEEYRRD